MKKLVAVLALVVVIFTVGSVVMDAKDYELHLKCKAECSFFHPPAIYPEDYERCYKICTGELYPID